MRTFSLRMRYRPIRWMCLADTEENLVDYIRFNLNTWGGRGNLIVPSPQTEHDYRMCIDLFERFRPDAVLYDSSSISVMGQKLISTVPTFRVDAGSHERIETLISGVGRLRINDAVIPNLIRDVPEFRDRAAEVTKAVNEHPVVRMLTLNRYVESRTEATESFQSNLMTIELKEGLRYALDNNLNIYGKDLSYTHSFNDIVVDGYDFQFLYLFRQKPSDLNVLSSYWNDSLHSTKNRLILSWDALRRDSSGTLEDLRKCCPNFKYLRIIVSATRDEAFELQEELKKVVKQLEQPFEVDIIYDDFAYMKGQYKLSYGKEVYDDIRSENSYITVPFPIPEWAQGSTSAFAVDVDIRENGRNYAVPYTTESRSVLTYGPAILRQYKYRVDQIEKMTSRTQVLPDRRGVSFITSHKRVDGHQRVVEISAPTGEELVESYLSMKGFQLSKNPPSQFANVLVKRLENQGLANKYLPELDVLFLLRGGHNSKLHRTYTQLSGEIGRKRKLADHAMLKKESQISKGKQSDYSTSHENQLQAQLANLIFVGMIQRGNEIECPGCGMTDWYAIENSGEFANCTGCNKQILVPIHDAVHYKLTDMGIRLLSTGGRAVAQALGVFRSNHTANVMAVGGNLTKDGVSLEVDAFRFTDDEFALVECKDRREPPDAKEIEGAAGKLVMDALSIGATSAYLYIGTNNAVQAETVVESKMISMHSSAEEHGVRLYLMVNDRIIFVEGSQVKCLEFRGVQYLSTLKAPACIGEYFRGHGHRDFADYIDKTAVDALS
ncbi:MAG: hypothetical protein IPH85_12230 [Ignavibacteria bacterium]|nr:hypothetical protein [Ignavibacteria bacterium]